MKVLIVTPYFYPKIGGLENYAYQIAKGLAKDFRWDVVVATINHEKNVFSKEVLDGLTIYRYPLLFKISNTPINPFLFREFRKLILEEKPDVINGHMPVAFVADVIERVRGNIPFVLTYHNDLVKENILLNFLCKLQYKLTINKTIARSNGIIVTNKYFIEKSPYLKKYSKKITIIHPGVNIKIFNTKVNLHKTIRDYFIFVGQLDRTHAHKGLDDLLRVISLAKHQGYLFSLVIVGEGDYLEHYRMYSSQLGIDDQVDFVGRVSDVELAEYYSGAIALVLPSRTNSEGFGMVIIEAAACSIPTIGKQVGGVPYVIDHNNTGILTKSYRDQDLMENMILLSNNRKYSKKLGKNARKLVTTEFLWSGSNKKTDDVFNKLI